MKVFVVTKMFLGRGSLADCRVLVESWVRKGYGTLAFSNLAIVETDIHSPHKFKCTNEIPPPKMRVTSIHFIQLGNVGMTQQSNQKKKPKEGDCVLA